jgi:chemotaxis protein methyltransferase CheR
MVRFFRLNLAEPSWPSKATGLHDLDLVLCRNALIYFGADEVAAVARRLFHALAPGGWLVPGASDPLLGRHAPFELASGRHGVAYRRPAHAPGAASRPPERRSPPATARRVVPAAAPRREAARAVTAARAPLRAPPAPDPDCADCRALIDAGKLSEAAARVEAALAAAPLRADLHLLRALVMTELGRLDEAEAACRRALYLDPRQPFVAFFLAMLRLQRGDAAAAARGFRAVRAALRGRPAEEEVPLSEGMTAGALLAAAESHLARVSGSGRGSAGT